MTFHQFSPKGAKLLGRSSGMVVRPEKQGKNRVGVMSRNPTEATDIKVEEHDVLTLNLSRERIPISQASCSLINYTVSKRDLMLPNTAIDRAIKRTSRYNLEPAQNPSPCLCQIM